MSAPGARVLSVQSVVAFGYVGNSAAAFPLQLHGLEVCAVPTTAIAAHTGYGTPRGWLLGGETAAALHAGLRACGALRRGAVTARGGLSHVLSGFAADADVLRTVGAMVDEVRGAGPREALTYVCDPVLGDDGRLYVPAALVDVYRTELIPRATLVTPNDFELRALTAPKSSERFASTDDAWRAMEDLLRLGADAVVLTSMPDPSDPLHRLILLADVPRAWVAGEDRAKSFHGEADEPAAAASAAAAAAGAAGAADEAERGTHARARFSIPIPRIQGRFTGTGDLFAALLLAFHHHMPRRFASACVHALAGLRATLLRTAAAAASPHPALDDADIAARVPLELRIVDARHDLLAPPHLDLFVPSFLADPPAPDATPAPSTP